MFGWLVYHQHKRLIMASCNPIKLILIFVFILQLYASQEERKLLIDLFKSYKKDVRPVRKSNETVHVDIKHTMKQILDIDERKELFITSGWCSLEWRDVYLSWNPEAYDGIGTIYVNPKEIWVPDIALYGNVDTAVFGNKMDQLQNRATVNHTGYVQWDLRATFIIICHYDIHDFPFDIQSCTFKYGSWSYEKGKIDISPRSRITVERNASHYAWRVLNTSAIIYEKSFTAGVYESIHFKVTFKRRALCHSLTIILPPLIVGTLVLLSFLLPAASGGRLTFSVTLLLSMIFYMVSTSRFFPRDDATIPLIYKFFIATLMEIFFVHVFLISSLQFYYKKSYDPPLPRWIKDFIMNRMSYWVGIQVDAMCLPENHQSSATKPDTEDLLSIIEVGFVNGESSKLYASQLSDHNHESSEAYILKEWRILALTIDRCFFLIFALAFSIIILVFAIKAAL